MKTKILIFATVLVALIVWSCSTDSASEDTGRLRVQLTDAPFPYDLIAEANVTIFKIDARYKKDYNGDDNMEDTTGMETEESDEDGKGFTVIMEGEKSINLLELTNGLTETLVDSEVPVGSYDLLRIYVRGVNVVLKDGTTFDLKVPSGSSSGIKVFINPSLEVAGGLTADLLLDFDVSRSFVAKGNPRKLEEFNGFNFKPVIKASNLTIAGSLSGMVTTMQEESMLGLEGAQVSIFAADTLNTTTFTDETGQYTILGLIAGSYDMEVSLEGYESQNAEGITILPGNKTIQDFELAPLP